MSAKTAPQLGVVSDPTPHAEYLTFELTDDVDQDEVAGTIASITSVALSVGQNDFNADLSITAGFGAAAWPRLFPEHPEPAELHPFGEMRDGERHFPSTGGDIFVMVKSNRVDLNYLAAKQLEERLRCIATLVEDVKGFRYLDDRDLIDFVDGTENPEAEERNDAVLVDAEHNYAGGSYLLVQRYVDHHNLWDALTTEEQEGVVGRQKLDDVEIADEAKEPFAHNLKSKVEIDGEEIPMFRQNRAFGNAMEHGTMFVGFAKSAATIETSLRQMITADDDGYYDKLLDFVEARSGALYFCPPQSFLDAFAD